LSFILIIEVGSCLKEGVERFINSLFPQEFPLAVLVQEFRSSISDFIEVAADVFHSVEKLELISNFNEVITASSVFVVKTGNLDSNRDEIVRDFVEDVSDTVVLLVRFNRR
jgi:hypothetical protein